MSQPSSQDFVKPFDPTGYTSITSADLGQLVDGITVYTDKGLLMSSDDTAGVPNVPNPAVGGLTKWKKFLWRRQLATTVIVYVWNDNLSPDGTYLQWQPITTTTIADFSIINQMLAAGAVSDDKVSTISYGKITGAPTSLPPSGAASGDLTGTYPAPTIAANAVTSTKLASDAAVDGNRAVGADHIKDKVVGVVRHLSITGLSAGATPVVNAGATSFTTFIRSTIADAANGVVTTGNQYMIPQVATAGAGDTGTWQMQTIAQLMGQATFESAEQAVTSGLYFEAAHNLGAKPRFVRAVLRCHTDELGYSASDVDEVDLACALCDASLAYPPLASYGANTTKVFLQVSTFTAVNIPKKAATAGNTAAITTGNWRIVIYARL